MPARAPKSVMTVPATAPMSKIEIPNQKNKRL
jgi:hypothetical protein